MNIQNELLKFDKCVRMKIQISSLSCLFFLMKKIIILNVINSSNKRWKEKSNAAMSFYVIFFFSSWTVIVTVNHALHDSAFFISLAIFSLFFSWLCFALVTKAHIHCLHINDANESNPIEHANIEHIIGHMFLNQKSIQIYILLVKQREKRNWRIHLKMWYTKMDWRQPRKREHWVLNTFER